MLPRRWCGLVSGAGDRVAILLPQQVAVPVTHLAVYRMGAIALPLAILFGVDALQYRLANAGVRVVFTDAAGAAKLRQIRDQLPALELMVSVDGDSGEVVGYQRFIAGCSDAFTTVDTLAEKTRL